MRVLRKCRREIVDSFISNAASNRIPSQGWPLMNSTCCQRSGSLMLDRPIFHHQVGNVLEVHRVAGHRNTADGERDRSDGEVICAHADFLRTQLIEDCSGCLIKR